MRGFTGARYKGFSDIEEARAWLRDQQTAAPGAKGRVRKAPPAKSASRTDGPEPALQADAVIYTDGGCLNNPGPGGYGAVILAGGTRREISGGFRHTTNNRMELTACIEALKCIAPGATVIVHSDSQYVVNGITKGWAAGWRSKGWMRTKSDPAENFDLWNELLELCEQRSVQFVWVKGHAGNTENERCDELATQAAAGSPTAIDGNFESGLTTVSC